MSGVETAIVLRLKKCLIKTHLHENRNATSERILPDCEVANFRDIEKKPHCFELDINGAR